MDDTGKAREFRVRLSSDTSLIACLSGIADFGLSEIKHHATSTIATQTRGDSEGDGTGVGTLRYMSPEALRGQIDKASDVYAYAMTVYEVGSPLVLAKIPTHTPVPSDLHQHATLFARPGRRDLPAHRSRADASHETHRFRRH
jgi:serine/threonine protein kinase